MERRKDILTAARMVFAREGFHGATIKKIAATAGLKSQSLVYWYFKDKKELFQATLEEIIPLLNQMPKFWERIDDPPEEMLPVIARTFLSTIDSPEAKQFFRIFLSEAPREPETANNAAEKTVLALNFIISYFDRQVDIGRFRPHNTQGSARSFVGSFMAYMFTREFFLPLRAGLPDRETYIQEIVCIFLRGLQNK